MKNVLVTYFRYLLLLMMTLALDVEGIPTKEAKPSFVRLSGYVHSNALKDAKYLGNLAVDKPVSLTFTLPLRNPEELEKLIKDLHNPSSRNYGKYLTTKEFIERFSPTQEDYDKVMAYAKDLGLTINGKHSNRLLLTVSGPTQSIESAFNLSLKQYQQPNGRKFHAPNNDPEVPTHIAAIITGVVGLDSHAVWKPYYRLQKSEEKFKASNEAARAFPSGPNGGFSPSDLVTAYKLGGISENGAGQIIALFELADYQESDINEYANHFGLPAPKLKRILVDGGSGVGIDPEVTLDIELALALAPQSEIYVYEGPNSGQGVLDTYNKIATDNIAKQVSTSWGLGEDLSNAQFLQIENAIFQQMAAQGQTIYAAAGDSGAYDDYDYNSSRTLIVDDPASQPYVVGVGGTTLKVNTESGAYASESVWNNGLGNGAGGGGVSNVWPIPAWQTNISTIHSKTHRNVPDVALNSNPITGYAIYYDGKWTIFGGTSCAAPLWASFTALVNQHLTSAQKPVLGFANPVFYNLCLGTTYATDFHDIKVGNNLYYPAQIGYDNASGWGSFNGANLFASLTNAEQIKTAPILNISMRHVGVFRKRTKGSYQIIVTNNGTAATSGPVNVIVSLPKGLTYLSASGAGWSFTKSTLTFTQTSVVNPGESYPPITLNVKVNANAAAVVTPQVTVTGGGSIPTSATNPTAVR